MDAGLVVVLAATGVFLLVPLGFAWLSTNPRRWSRVEGVLGRELPAGMLSPRWIIGLWAGMGAAYIAIGIAQARTDKPDGFPWVSLTIGVAYILNGGFNYLIYRRRRKAETSVQTQVEGRAEPGRPRPGR
jgi:hypothetical protein